MKYFIRNSLCIEKYNIYNINQCKYILDILGYNNNLWDFDIKSNMNKLFNFSDSFTIYIYFIHNTCIGYGIISNKTKLNGWNYYKKLSKKYNTNMYLEYIEILDKYKNKDYGSKLLSYILNDINDNIIVECLETSFYYNFNFKLIDDMSKYNIDDDSKFMIYTH